MHKDYLLGTGHWTLKEHIQNFILFCYFPPMDRRFGNYILHERVGIGGMGEVFRATKHGPDGFEVQVALKVILPHLAREESFKKRFTREACLAAFLKHPNIVHVNGFEIIDETPFIEMEYVPGADLRRILRSMDTGERLSLDESLAILYAVSRGLDHAHRYAGPENAEGGIIHCDLNPHNILISTLGETKVADFGIARAMHSGAAASATVRGKLAYMSPEQMEGRELDQRTDLFSLGIIAYQLLSGDHPFERESEGATITAIGKAEHLPLSDKVSGLPPVLYELVDQLLSLDPASRPANTTPVLEILQPLVTPAAETILASRIRSLKSEPLHKSSHAPGTSPTAPTIRRTDALRLWRYLAIGAAGIALIAAVFLLQTDLSPDPPPLPEVVSTKPALPVQQPPHEMQTLERVVTVQTTPPGAKIIKNGIALGITPLDIKSETDGSMPRLEARLYGFRNDSFQVPPGTMDRFLVNLEPLPTGTVRISARPWARVTFRGKEMGETPLSINDIPVGQHTFRLSYDPLGAEKEIVVEVKEGTNTVSAEMREE